jgi:ABC-2 type transport system ATP-binding protein
MYSFLAQYVKHEPVFAFLYRFVDIPPPFGYFPTPMPVLEAVNLTKTYSTGIFKKVPVHALAGVSLSVNEGEIFGLLGPNGAGKTTFVKVLLSIVRPSSGSASILGYPLGSLSIRRSIGYLPENHRYPSFLTALQTLVHFGRLAGISSSELTAKSLAVLGQVGLAEWSKVKIKKFSKGMMQRLGLAQAMLNDPQLLFLDEPTDGVDPIGRKEIRDILKDLRSRGRTIFLNSHMLSEVEEVSDRVAILNKGELLQVGTIAEITSHRLEYEIQLTDPVTEHVRSLLTPICKTVHANQRSVSISVGDKKDLQRALDALRASGVEIESFAPKKSSLEDYFLKVLQPERT